MLLGWQRGKGRRVVDSSDFCLETNREGTTIDFTFGVFGDGHTFLGVTSGLGSVSDSNREKGGESSV